MKKTLSYLKPYIIVILISTMCIFIQSMANLYLPNIMSDIINEGIVKQSLDNVYRFGQYMLMITLVAMMFNILAVYIAARVSSGYGTRLRNAVYSKVQTFSLKEFNQFSAASLITRTTNDITQVQNTVAMMMRMVVQAPIMCIGGIIMALTTNAELSFIFTVVVPIILVVIFMIAKKIVPLFSKYQIYIDRLNQIIREKLTGVRVIRSFNNQKLEKERYDKASTDIYDVYVKVNNTMAVLMPAIMFVVNISSVAIVWFGSKLIGSNALQIGDMMAFIQYAMQVLFSILMVSMMFVMIPRAIVSVKRINEVLDTDSDITDGDDKEQEKEKGTIEFKHVSFGYGDGSEYAVKDINLKINKGETVAIIGGTGSGKTTLLNLMLRFYDASYGEVLINGKNVKDYSLKTLRDLISYVPQKAYLFSGNVAENITYGKQDADLNQMEKAAKMADAYTFVTSDEQGFNQTVAQGGTNFSGGQKQRLSIARALLKDADIYVFDDSFSALDYATDKKVRNEIEENLVGKTKIIVAQRVATVMNAHQIILIEEGKIVAMGSHKDLFEHSQEYKEIVLSQVTEEEAKRHA